MREKFFLGVEKKRFETFDFALILGKLGERAGLQNLFKLKLSRKTLVLLEYS